MRSVLLDACCRKGAVKQCPVSGSVLQSEHWLQHIYIYTLPTGQYRARQRNNYCTISRQFSGEVLIAHTQGEAMLAALTPSIHPGLNLNLLVQRSTAAATALLQHCATKAYVTLSVIQLITSLRIRSFPGSFSSTCHLPGISLNCLSFDCKAPQQVSGNPRCKRSCLSCTQTAPPCAFAHERRQRAGPTASRRPLSNHRACNRVQRAAHNHPGHQAQDKCANL